MASNEFLGASSPTDRGGTTSLMATLAFFSAGGGAPPARLLLDRLLSFSPLPAMAKSVLDTSFLCLLLIHHQKPPKEARRTTTTGTTIAGIRVAKLSEPAPEDAVDVSEAASLVLEEVWEAREADSTDWIEENWAASVMGTTPLLVVVLATPSMVVSKA